MTQRILHLACYDVAEPRRLVAALKLTRAYATGGQKSVHELYLTQGDLWVWELLRSHTLREEHFTLDKGACLLGKEGRHIYYSAWEKGSKPLRRWLRLQCKRLAHELRHKGQTWLLQVSQAGDASWD
jgi:hypothetical protein